MRPPYFIESEKNIDLQLRNFQSKRVHQAVVLDKDGEATGLVNLSDIWEELAGNIGSEYSIK